MPLSTIPLSAKIALSFQRTRAPLLTDDAASGYATGTIWVDTSTGDAYLCISASPGNAQWSLIQEIAAPPAEALRWSPPTLGSNVVNYTLTNANRTTLNSTAGAGRDLVVNQVETITGGGNPSVSLDGWRHVIWIGGAFDLPASLVGSNQANAIAPRNCTGTIHFEGIDIALAADGIVPRLGNNQIIQIQNCRIRVDTSGTGFHADCFQLQGTRLLGLRFDKCTFITNYQGFFLQNEFSIDPGAYCRDVVLQRTNFRGNGTGTIHFLFQVWTEGDSTTDARAVVPITLVNDGVNGDTVWIDGGARPVAQAAYWVHPDQAFQDPFSGVNYAVRRGSFLGSDANGSYVYFSTGGETVPAGGSKSGQTTLDCRISGKLRVGIPPGGDYCPAGVPGLAYVSPGYA